jgi:hypothetical protein
MDHSFLHSTLCTASEEAFEHGSRYFDKTDCWEEVPDEANRRSFIIVTDDYVTKYSFSLNKSPEQAIRYLRENRVGLFERHRELFIRSVLLNEFKDESYFEQNILHSPAGGEFSIFDYVSVKAVGDALWLVRTSPNGDAWTRGLIWHDFDLLKFEPVEGGSVVTGYLRGESAFPLSEEMKRMFWEKGKKYYFGILEEINSQVL